MGKSKPAPLKPEGCGTRHLDGSDIGETDMSGALMGWTTLGRVDLSEVKKKLHRDLEGKGVRCWFAPEDMKIGDRIRPKIDEAIRVHDKLLLVLTESSVKSPWVEKEVETALEKERKQGRTVLFPITLDDAVTETEEAWAADQRRMRHIGDFRKWKEHYEYKKAFERLMRDLKAEAKKEPG